jgi:hypothetical protein
MMHGQRNKKKNETVQVRQQTAKLDMSMEVYKLQATPSVLQI